MTDATAGSPASVLPEAKPPASSDDTGPVGHEESLVWFFGYGSLMWNPGFVYAASEAARLDGWHRRFCILSGHYRGTPDNPGLVLGLAPSGSCVGRAFGVAPAGVDEVVRYLDAREHVGGDYVYERQYLPVTVLASGRVVRAWCYVADTTRPDYQGGLDTKAVLARIATASGLAGSNRDYALNTVAHLREIGIVEPELEELARLLR